MPNPRAEAKENISSLSTVRAPDEPGVIAMATRIHQPLVACPSLDDHLVSIVRPSKPYGPQSYYGVSPKKVAPDLCSKSKRSGHLPTLFSLPEKRPNPFALVTPLFSTTCGS